MVYINEWFLQAKISSYCNIICNESYRSLLFLYVLNTYFTGKSLGSTTLPQVIDLPNRDNAAVNYFEMVIGSRFIYQSIDNFFAMQDKVGETFLSWRGN